MANRFWVGGSATWDGTVGTKWSLTSGGIGGQAVPTSADDVFFDGASGAVTCTVSGTRSAKSINCTGFTGTLTGTGALNVSGSVTFVAGMTMTVSGRITFLATGTFTSGGKTVADVTVNGAGITVTLGDAMTSSEDFIVTAGTFNAAGYNFTASTFDSSGSTARTVTMGSGTWTLTGTGTVWDLATVTNLTFNANTANIVLSGAVNSSAKVFEGGNKTYNTLTIGGGAATSQSLAIDGINTFGDITSTKTVAHTVFFRSGQTFANWSLSGSAGNLVTLQASSTAVYTLTKSGGGYLTGIDYLTIVNLVASPISDTWYIGTGSTYRTTSNLGRGFFLTQREATAVIVLDSTTSSTFTVPIDWNNTNNTIHLFGGGGGGAGSRSRAGGGGGGGGGYTKLLNQTEIPGASITYQAGSNGVGGSAAVNGTAGGTTSWDSGASTAGGGGGGSATSGSPPTSTGGTAGVGSTFNGGVGGAGAITLSVSVGCGGGGGAGAGGPNGAGGTGGNGISSSTAGNIAGGGGGGNGGGTVGGNASAATGGTGGNSAAGVGGGTSNTNGAVGGGAGGSTGTANSFGGAGIDVLGVGGGGGGGGGDDENDALTTIGGFYGGGGGGAGTTTAGTTFGGASGRQGVVIVTYVPATPQAKGFFLLFN